MTELIEVEKNYWKQTATVLNRFLKNAIFKNVTHSFFMSQNMLEIRKINLPDPDRNQKWRQFNNVQNCAYSTENK